MKFLILASLFVLSVVAEPEAEAEPEAQYLNYYGTPANTYPVTYGYPTAYTGYPAFKTYAGYPATTAYTRYPATTAYAGYPTTTAYGGYPYTYKTLPTTTFNTAYNRYPYTYGTYVYNPYNLFQTQAVQKRVTREAELECVHPAACELFCGCWCC